MTPTPLQETIINIVRERQRNLPPSRGVLPRTVGCFLDEYRCEQTLRRDMSSMARVGLLDRIGGERSRRGYRVQAHPATPPPPPRIVIEIKLTARVSLQRAS